MNIVDAQQLHKDFPETFKVPSQEALNILAQGDLIKICVSDERFWVRIENIQGDKVTGHIYSDLVRTQYHGLKANDRIEFEKKHICSIQ